MGDSPLIMSVLWSNQLFKNLEQLLVSAPLRWKCGSSDGKLRCYGMPWLQNDVPGCIKPSEEGMKVLPTSEGRVH